MERIRKALERIKSTTLTLDSAFRRFFERDTACLKEFRGNFEEAVAARLAIHLRDERGCINQEVEQEGFEFIASVIKSCPDKIKPKRKGSANANTSSQRRRRNA